MCGWGATKSKLTQPQVELEAWAELGKIQNHQINKPSATKHPYHQTTKPSTHQTIKPAKHQTSKTANQQTIKPSNYGFVYGPKVFISKWRFIKISRLESLRRLKLSKEIEVGSMFCITRARHSAIPYKSISKTHAVQP